MVKMCCVMYRRHHWFRVTLMVTHAFLVILFLSSSKDVLQFLTVCGLVDFCESVVRIFAQEMCGVVFWF